MELFKHKKAHDTGGDSFSFLASFFVIVALVLLVMYGVVPLLKNNMKHKVEDIMQKYESVFLLHFLDYPYQSGSEDILASNTADLIVSAYQNKNFSAVTLTTNDILRNLYNKDIGWKMEINDNEVAKCCDNSLCKGEEKSYETLLPALNKNAIKLRLKMYFK